PGPAVPASMILRLPDALRAAQLIFEQTGGLHAAGTFDRQGRVVAVREDVGRHNALDKLVGRALLAGELPVSDQVLMLSGRVSFELVQKAAVAGLPVVCAVSAPSSLAVDTADALGIAVVGFVRGAGLNVYTHPERVDLEA
ncbi:MAG: formate dehydrogenase accessory sulfurtransferase FdhD, partial [Acidimicrobiia bacterium]